MSEHKQEFIVSSQAKDPSSKSVPGTSPGTTVPSQFTEIRTDSACVLCTHVADRIC